MVTGFDDQFATFTFATFTFATFTFATMACTRMTGEIFPGMRVRHPAFPDWGIGQVQSVAGERITVNFEHAGKKTLIGPGVVLEPLPEERA